MGETKKAIKAEIKAIYKNVLSELDESQKRLDDDEKSELREYIEILSDGTCHSFSHIFIKRKIEQLINRRKDKTLHDTGNIDKLIDDDPAPSMTSLNTDLIWLLQKHDIELVIEGLRGMLPEKYAELNLVKVEDVEVKTAEQ